MRRLRVGVHAVLPVLLWAAVVTWARADNIRGTVRAEVRLAAESTFEQTVEIRYQEMVLVTLPEDMTFVQGVQFELSLPAETRTHFDNFGFVVYDRLDSLPAPGFRALTGRRAFLHGLLDLNRIYFVATLSGPRGQPHDFGQGIFRLPEPARAEDFPILASVIPIMKGVPESAQDLVFYLKCRPLLRSAGLAQIRIVPPDGEHRFDVWVDQTSLSSGASSSPWETTIELPAGLHTLRVSSRTLLAAESTFTIEPAGTASLVVELKPLEATVDVQAPRGATVSIDGRRLDYPRESRIALLPGEHVVRFWMGDYSNTRTFTVAEGKRYTVYLEMNIGVKEN